MNKLKLLLTTLGLSGLFLFTGCGQQPNLEQKCMISGEEAPQWICNGGDVDGTITSVGYAKRSPLGFSFQKAEAMADARDGLSRQISLKVKNMFKKYEATTGSKNDTADKAVENVSKQISANVLNNSKQLKLWIDKDKNMYILVGVNKNVVKQTLTTSLHNKNALWQKFLSDKAMKELDKEVEKEF